MKHGFHNVSRWMTWLPISLKNAAKCDKWYQLQNHSITESLNANGAREKPSTAYLVHAVFSVSNKNPNHKRVLVCIAGNRKAESVRSSGYPESPSQRRFMGNAIFFLGQKKKRVTSFFFFGTTNENSLFSQEEKEPHFLLLQTWVRQGHPPNLSILLSGGKENNRDSLSERRANRDRTRCRIGSYMALSCGKNAALWLVWDWRNSMCKANPLLNTTLHVSIEPKKVTAHWAKNPSTSLGSTKRVALLGSEASIGRYVSAKVKYRVGRPISNK